MEWLLALHHRRLHEDDAGVNTGNEPLAALAATTPGHEHHHMVRFRPTRA